MVFRVCVVVDLDDARKRTGNDGSTLSVYHPSVNTTAITIDLIFRVCFYFIAIVAFLILIVVVFVLDCVE